MGWAHDASADYLAERFAHLPFLPYKPVRRQLLSALRAVNRVRREAALERVPVTAVPWRRPIVRVFGLVEGVAPMVGDE